MGKRSTAQASKLKRTMISLLLLSLAGLSAGTSYYNYGLGYRTYYSPRVVLPSYYKSYVAAPAAVRTVAYATPQSNLDLNSPSARSALSYLAEGAGLDSCGQQTKAYIDVVINGGSRAEAEAIATQIYQRDYGKVPLSAACVAAENAWKAAVASGADPVLQSALAFMDASPSESPCYVSAKDYVQAIVGGAQHVDAGLVAAKSFAAQIVNLANQGKSTIDPACARSAIAYSKSSAKPSAPNAAAMEAFIAKALEVGSSFDPVCLKSTERFWESYANNQQELTSTFSAARDFLSTYSANPTIASRSPCAAAAKAYAQTILASPSSPNQAALYAFIDTALLDGSAANDPVCKASSEAYFNAYQAGVGEAGANEAAAVAYLDTVAANPAFDPKSPCGRAADAYIAAFNL